MINKNAQAGTFESNDIFIKVSKGTGINVDLKSSVMQEFGDDIVKVITETVESEKIKNITIEADDKGAIDYTIIARVKTAIRRAK